MQKSMQSSELWRCAEGSILVCIYHNCEQFCESLLSFACQINNLQLLQPLTASSSSLSLELCENRRMRTETRDK